MNPFPPSSETRPSPLILWIDLETTGLQSTCGVLEAAHILTDFRGEIVDHHSAVFSCDGLFWEREAIAMHLHNRLLRESVESRETFQSYLVKLAVALDVCAKPGQPVHIGGSSVHFDQMFLKKYWPGGIWPFHHRLLDMSAVKLFLDTLNVSVDAGIKSSAHRAEVDVRYSLELFRAARRRLELIAP